MASLNTQRKKARHRDGYQCQFCGDTPECPYTKIQVHHIHPRAEGGTDDLENLICLCDLCHACCHWHLGPAWCGFSAAQQPELSLQLQQVRDELVSFLHLALPEQCRVQQDVENVESRRQEGYCPNFTLRVS